MLDKQLVDLVRELDRDTVTATFDLDVPRTGDQLRQLAAEPRFGDALNTSVGIPANAFSLGPAS